MYSKCLSNTRKLATRTATLAALALLTGLYAPSASAEKAGPMDEKAGKILQGMSDYLAKAGTISFRVKTFYDEVRESGIKIKTARKGSVLLKRPNQSRPRSVLLTGRTFFAGLQRRTWQSRRV